MQVENCVDASEAPVVPHDSPRFSLDAEKQEIVDYLEEHGYVVIRDVLNETDIATEKDHFWDFVEDQLRGINRRDPATWEYWPGDSRTGIISGDINHSEFLWYARLNPKVKEAFALIWGTDDLLTSFDAGNAFRPWDKKPKYRTQGGWWHVDQSSLKGKERQGRVSVQGLVTMYDANEETGGFAVVPGSHKFHDIVCQQAPRKVDFVPILGNFPAELVPLPKILVKAKAGDMILWDSRTVHCNVPGSSVPQNVETLPTPTNPDLKQKDSSGDTPDSSVPLVSSSPSSSPSPASSDLLRLVAYVCMQPRSMASEKAVQGKRLALLYRIPTSHWATNEIDPNLLELFVTKYTSEQQRLLVEASEEKLRLSGFSEEEIRTRRLADHHTVFSKCLIS